MTINRRNFLRASLSGVALTTLGGASIVSCASSTTKDKTGKNGKEEKAVELKLSFQEGTAPGESLNEKFDYMERLGIAGYEPGGNGLAGRVAEIKQALQGRNIQISAICAGFKGFILSTDEAVRNEFFSSMKEIIAAAGELGSVGVVMVPAFNSQTPVFPHTQETRDFLCEQLNTLGNYAVEHGTTVILEPLNRKEAFYLRMVADAASICRDINNPGVRCMGDLWHMVWEETSDSGALLSAGEYLQHVHIASRKRRSMPGEDGEADNYIDAFKALKQLRYDKYVSYECGCQGDKAIVLPESVKLLREQWEQA
ncbi:MAG: sugar phosphate isomerase/epimerase [Dysgonamonadaceae bacterium]|jgi:sugar phosphate isomerase/epimerase|nr:sugar phosphate isomerase/epimerase [Dysgonamonadaceae bacterium]